LIALAEAADATPEAGVKAANLGAALLAGFPVPDGVVLTAETVAAADGPLPEALDEALRRALERLGGRVAVRSSALAEDLHDASFAGQYETVLDVQGLDALLSAIRHCRSSASAERVAAYRSERAADSGGGMAILIQRMVPAQAAGVAFTANPVTGDRTEILVSAVRGLGERLVSGAATPDEWIVRGDDVESRGAAEGAIDATAARAVADLARRVEAQFGAPQDIEWALADGQVFLLQARPITTLRDEERVSPIAVPVAAPEGRWEREASHSPKPHSPMNRSLMIEHRNEAIRRTFAQFGVLADGLEFRDIGGWEYTRLVPMGGKDAPALPAALMWMLARLHPELRRRRAIARRALGEDYAAQIIQRWYDEVRPDLQSRIQILREVDLCGLSDGALLEHWAGIASLLEIAIPAHFELHAPIAFARKTLVDSCQALLGWDETRAFELLAGLSLMSTAPAAALADLARLARDRPAVLALIERADRASASLLADADPDFASAFEAYQRGFSIRGLRYEVAEVTLAEAPEITLATMRDQLRSGYDPSRQAALLAARRAELIADARARLAANTEELATFEHHLARAEEAHPVHEENEFYTVSVPIALARYALLELGRRLTERGAIADPDDVFFLEIAEALEAFRMGDDRRALVLRRKGERAWVLAHPGPQSYGPEAPPPPSLKPLPGELRTVMEVVFWLVERSFAAERSAHRNDASASAILGFAASAGRYTGPVRVVMGEHEFHKVEAGDVLVCPITSPVWSILFSRIGALVTDTGGILSHPAIIAREYGIPAVVATGDATALLEDGQRVTVDGDAGIVER
jgi:pyruvate,water dikinase